MKNITLISIFFFIAYSNISLAKEMPINQSKQVGSSCYIGDQVYRSGATATIGGQTYQCVDGQWIKQ